MQHLRADGLDLKSIIRPRDAILWGQACGEPLTLTEALVQQRRELGGNAARAMKRLHPQQVVAEFDALLAELAQSRRNGHAHYAA